MELNLIQAEHVKMFNERRTFTGNTDNYAILSSDAEVLAQLGRITSKRTELDEAINIKIIDTSGESPEKQSAKGTVIKTLGKKARASAIYFRRQGMLTEAASCKKPKTYYEDLLDEDIINKLNDVRGILFTNKANLGNFGVTDAWFLIVDAQIQALSDLITAPSSAQAAADAANGVIDTKIDEMMVFQDDLDVLVMNAFEDTHEGLVNALIALNKLTTLGRRHNEVEFLAKRASDGSVINHLKIEIRDEITGLIVKTVYTNSGGEALAYSKIKNYIATASGARLVSQEVGFRLQFRKKIHIDLLMKNV